MIPFETKKPNSVLQNTAIILVIFQLFDVSSSSIQLTRMTDREQITTVSSQPFKDIRRSLDMDETRNERMDVIKDVRADSRQAGIDARDIRTDFREIRTELNNRRSSTNCYKVDNIRRQSRSDRSVNIPRTRERFGDIRRTDSRSNIFGNRNSDLSREPDGNLRSIVDRTTGIRNTDINRRFQEPIDLKDNRRTDSRDYTFRGRISDKNNARVTRNNIRDRRTDSRTTNMNTRVQERNFADVDQSRRDQNRNQQENRQDQRDFDEQHERSRSHFDQRMSTRDIVDERTSRDRRVDNIRSKVDSRANTRSTRRISADRENNIEAESNRERISHDDSSRTRREGLASGEREHDFRRFRYVKEQSESREVRENIRQSAVDSRRTQIRDVKNDDDNIEYQRRVMPKKNFGNRNTIKTYDDLSTLIREKYSRVDNNNNEIVYRLNPEKSRTNRERVFERHMANLEKLERERGLKNRYRVEEDRHDTNVPTVEDKTSGMLSNGLVNSLQIILACALVGKVWKTAQKTKKIGLDQWLSIAKFKVE